MNKTAHLLEALAALTRFLLLIRSTTTCCLFSWHTRGPSGAGSGHFPRDAGGVPFRILRYWYLVVTLLVPGHLCSNPLGTIVAYAPHLWQKTTPLYLLITWEGSNFFFPTIIGCSNASWKGIRSSGTRFPSQGPSLNQANSSGLLFRRLWRHR